MPLIEDVADFDAELEYSGPVRAKRRGCRQTFTQETMRKTTAGSVQGLLYTTGVRTESVGLRWERMTKRKISGQDLVNDVRLGLNCTVLMDKYQISFTTLDTFLEKLVESERLRPEEMDDVLSWSLED